MTTLESLRPARKERVMDLLESVGMDVTDWANFKGGIHKAAANPKYCYKWSYHVDDNLIVLNIWHSQIVEENGEFVIRDSMREVVNLFRGKNRGAWVQRATEFDASVSLAARQGIPIRLIVCDGTRRERNDPEMKAAQVLARGMDGEAWFVRKYNDTDGQFELARGSARVVDQFSSETGDDQPVPRFETHGTAWRRDRLVRSAVLSRSKGRCEFCGAAGFKTGTGATYLETHHVVPLSEGGFDSSRNVVALCANHHREAHHGINREDMRIRLLQIACPASQDEVRIA